MFHADRRDAGARGLPVAQPSTDPTPTNPQPPAPIRRKISRHRTARVSGCRHISPTSSCRGAWPLLQTDGCSSRNGRGGPDCTERTLIAAPALTLTDVAADGEGGLLGIALHPSFDANHLVYLVYTAQTSGGRVNRLVRYREVNQILGERAVLLDNIPAASIHDGSRIRFGPDGFLYMTMGDAADPSLAQSLGSLNGKLLRLTDTGTAAPGNPFTSPIWSYGHRNPQGLDWHPVSGELWESEHGQTGNDEINLIQRGGNHGWRYEGPRRAPI